MEVKKPSSYDEQINKMIKCGCEVDDQEFAKAVLGKINYYRLTAYSLPFKNADGTYKPNTQFKTIYMLHEFDRELRTLCFSAIEEIELMLRSQLAYYHTHRYGSLGYLCSDNFNPCHNEERFIEHINRDIENNKNQPFVKHHKDKYEGNFPLWVIIELLSFGDLSYFYSDMHIADQKNVAKRICGSTPKNISSWLICLTHFRNYCAHYSRLYYSQFPAQPRTPKGFEYQLQKKVFDYILILKFLYPKQHDWNEKFSLPLEEIINKYEKNINLNHISFPINWKDLINSELNFHPEL